MYRCTNGQLSTDTGSYCPVVCEIQHRSRRASSVYPACYYFARMFVCAVTAFPGLIFRTMWYVVLNMVAITSFQRPRFLISNISNGLSLSSRFFDSPVYDLVYYFPLAWIGSMDTINHIDSLIIKSDNLTWLLNIFIYNSILTYYIVWQVLY